MRREVDEEFAQYVRARQHRLLRGAFLVCGDTHLAEELLEGALAKLAARWGRLRAEDPDAYVRRLLYRDAVSSSRRARRESLDLHLERLPDAPNPGDVDDRVDPERALELLTPRQRAVLVLRFFEDRTEADTAEALGVSTRSVRSQSGHHRAAPGHARPRTRRG
jgi:RNA polymerase sigma-70 factor (sigma-E family)